MKRSFLYVSMIGASILAGGAAAYTVTKLSEPAKLKIVEVSSPQAGSHFTAYKAENYPDLTYAAENAVRAVVNIEKVEEVQNPYGGRQGGGGFNPFFEFFGLPDSYGQGQRGMQEPQERRSGGSGVIISTDGYIVTNNHVIENPKKLKVTLRDNTVYEAKLIGTDPTSDIALIKIDAKDLPTLPFGNSDDLRLGEWVLAIGSPFDLRSTVTAGIVSAKARNLDVIPGEFRIESFIQTDAAVNPGNSGGALVNTRGQLVGINTVIKSPTGSYTGYSFAVPVSIVQKIVVDLKEYGVVQRALLGVQFKPIDAAFIEREGEELGITEQGGVYVADVIEGGAAEAAGMKKGDIITQINGTKIDGTAPLLEEIARHRPNDKIKVAVKRGKEVKQFDVVLRNKAGKAELLPKNYVDAQAALGGKFAEIDAATKKELRIDGGVRVTAIDEGGILSKARVRKGYVITHINDRPIRSLNDLSRIGEKITSIDGVYPDGRAASYYTLPDEK